MPLMRGRRLLQIRLQPIAQNFRQVTFPLKTLWVNLIPKYRPRQIAAGFQLWLYDYGLEDLFGGEVAS
jgi:hypothetical protein